MGGQQPDGTRLLDLAGTNQVVKTIPVGNGPTGVCVAAGAVWVADLLRPRASCGSIRPAAPDIRSPWTTGPRSWPAAAAPSGPAASPRGPSRRSAPLTATWCARIPAGGGASGLAFGDGALWVANTRDGTVSRIDPRSGAPTALVPVGADAGPATSRSTRTACGSATSCGHAGPHRPRAAGGRRSRSRSATAAAGPRARGRHAVGRRTRLGRPASRRHPSVLDQGRAVPCRGASQAGPRRHLHTGGGTHPGLINDGLVTFRRVGGRQRATLVADLAVSLPMPTDRGRTYAFQLRPGSVLDGGAGARLGLPPPARACCAQGRRARGVLRRDPRSQGVRSAAADCDLSPGIRVDDAAGTITFRLTAADPDFLYKLAQPFAVPVPPGTRVRPPQAAAGHRPVPGRASSIASTSDWYATRGFPLDRRQASRLCRRDRLRPRRRSARGDPCGPARACGPRGHRGPQRRAAGAARRDRDAVRRTAARRRAAPHQSSCSSTRAFRRSTASTRAAR